MNTPISAILERKAPGVHAVAPRTTVLEAVAEMNRHRIGSVVVLDGSQLVGIFTERDVLQRVVGANLDLHRTFMTDVMTKELTIVTPATTIEEAMVLFTDRRCRHLPVVSEGRLVGLVSIGDATRWMVDLHRTECEHLKNYIAGSFPT